ncbi:MAG TPA: biopolymer transporter ExbD, partial [Candidatus Baltobacteraceae bacterium]|nr:biopolymer transporter ExbD [Candidatus Baltobacteraceae bacterium]
NKQRMNLAPLITQLASEFKSNPNLIIYIRADKDSRFDLFAQLVDACQRNGISRYSVRTAPIE